MRSRAASVSRSSLVQHREQPLLVGQVIDDGAVDDLEAGRREPHEQGAAIVRVGLPRHEAGLLEAVEAGGHRARRDHQRAVQLRRRHAVRRPAAAQRRQHVEAARLQAVLGEHLVEPALQAHRGARDAADDADRRRVEVGPGLAPRGHDAVDDVGWRAGRSGHGPMVAAGATRLDSELLEVERSLGLLSRCRDIRDRGISPAMSDDRLALQTAIAPVAWGTTYIALSELLPPDRPLLAALGRALPAGLLLAALFRGLPRGDWWWKAPLLGLLNVGGFFALLLVSADRLPGGVTATFGAVGPLVVAGLAWALLGTRPTVRILAAGLAGAIGVALLVLTASAALDPLGVAAGVGATLSASTGIVLTRRFGPPPQGALVSAGWQLIAASVFLLPLTLALEGAPADAERLRARGLRLPGPRHDGAALRVLVPRHRGAGPDPGRVPDPAQPDRRHDHRVGRPRPGPHAAAGAAACSSPSAASSPGRARCRDPTSACAWPDGAAGAQRARSTGSFAALTSSRRRTGVSCGASCTSSGDVARLLARSAASRPRSGRASPSTRSPSARSSAPRRRAAGSTPSAGGCRSPSAAWRRRARARRARASACGPRARTRACSVRSNGTS